MSIHDDSRETAPNVPILFWSMLSKEDQREYLALRNNFHNSTTSRSHGTNLQNDLRTILSYIERSSDNQDVRSAVTGICFAGSYICVNTSQLKYLLGRCKSSINNGFQQLGYISAKNKVRQCITTCMPILLKDSSLLRQWTMRSIDSSSSPKPVQLPPPLPMPQHYRSPFPTPVVNKNPPLPTPIINATRNRYPPSAYVQTKPDNVVPMSLPKVPSFNFDIPSFDPTMRSPFLDQNDSILSDLITPSSAPRPMSVPAFGFELYDDHPNYNPDFDNQLLDFVEPDLQQGNDGLEWGRFGDSLL